PFPGFGALSTTANDMLKFVAANLDPSAKPLGEALALSHKSHREAWGPTTAIGLGWIIGRVGNKNLVWHAGLTPSCSGFIGFDPVKRIGVVILTNTGDSQVYDFGLLDDDPPAIQALHAALVKRGFEHALEVVNEMKAKDPKFQLSE